MNAAAQTQFPCAECGRPSPAFAARCSPRCIELGAARAAEAVQARSRPVSKNDWQERADFMRAVGATEAEWTFSGELIALKLAPQQRAAAPAQPATPPGPAAKVATAFAERMKREHETRFAASHFKPRLDVPEVTDNVPRAVRDREVARGGAPSNKRRR